MAHPSTAEVYRQVTFYVIVTLLVLCWSTVLLRLWVRLRIKRPPGWDDATMVLTLCLFTSYCAFILVITIRGGLDHQPTPEFIMQTLLYVQLGEVFYILTTTALKISLGLFFMRLLTKRWQTNVFRTIIAVSGLYGVFYVFIAVFQCGSPDKLADSLLDAPECLPSWFLLTTGYLYGIINVIADWTFVLIPICVLVESDMDRRSKISVSIVMAFGAIGSISSILRMVYLRGLLFGGNITTDAVKATVWATTEPGTGIVASSIAILRPLFRNISNSVRGKLSEYSASKSRSMATIARDETHSDNDTVALTSMGTPGSDGSRVPKKASMYSMRSSTDDPWDSNVTLEGAHLGRLGPG